MVGERRWRQWVGWHSRIDPPDSVGPWMLLNV